MEFQKHVREATGGNNHSCVDCTKLTQAIVDTLTAVAEEARREAFGEVRAWSTTVFALHPELRDKITLYLDSPISNK